MLVCPKSWRVSSTVPPFKRLSVAAVCLMPVSYTHLDVYKRQLSSPTAISRSLATRLTLLVVMRSPLLRFAIELKSGALGSAPPLALRSVSYTHLDVYKRQIQDRYKLI